MRPICLQAQTLPCYPQEQHEAYEIIHNLLKSDCETITDLGLIPCLALISVQNHTLYIKNDWLTVVTISTGEKNRKKKNKTYVTAI